MNSQNSLNLSIQLEENGTKNNKDETDELVQLANKIEESDRNTDMMRQLKKQKLLEDNRLKSQHREILKKKQLIEKQHQAKSDALNEVKAFTKNKKEKFQIQNRRYEENTIKEKEIDRQNNQITRDNLRRERRILDLQAQYDELIAQNRQKSIRLQQMKKNRQAEDTRIMEQEQKVEELEQKCQITQRNAEKVYGALIKEKNIREQLQIIVSEKQKQLQNYRFQKEISLKRNEQAKKEASKMLNKAKSIENQIDQKKNEVQRLANVQQQLQKQLEKVENSQCIYEQMIRKRRQYIEQMKKCNIKMTRQQQNIDQLTENQNAHQN